MSRSFIIDTNHNVDITLKQLLEYLTELKIFNVTDLSIWHNGNVIDLELFNEISLLLNNAHTCFKINSSYIHIDYKCNGNSSENLWYIESRALDGVDRTLFVAIACIISNLSNGLVSSGDGAWYNGDKKYQGTELWKEYLDIEFNSNFSK